MAKTAKNGLDKQSSAIGQFQSVLRSEEARIRQGEGNFIERLMEKSAERQEKWQSKIAQKAEQPRFSHRVPGNPLNSFYMLTSEEQKAVQKRLKAEAKTKLASASE